MTVKAMIFRLLVGSIFAILVLALWAVPAQAQVCTPSLTPEQAFLAVTNLTGNNGGTTKPSANLLANSPKVININTASETQLTQLDGIGAKKAQQIILYRRMIAPFATADDLANVKGIGKATVDKNRHRITTQ
ncbi:ComEA family DNA-binding protein [Moraxella sp. CTOTU49803]|uniref:ComEA family DNA-binding protein n=1 Tax=Moraxella sp. CTOTU49803 TaxID=2953840 RepID=UPI0028A64EE7|nr:ComEA family DNA-binding protein [Moraxella sp. CTOTU49803]